MPTWDEAESWAEALLVGAHLVLTTPAFLALLLLGGVACWLFWKFWYRRQIVSAKGERDAAKGERDAALRKAETAETAEKYWQTRYTVEHDQHTALRAALEKEQKDKEALERIEIARGNPLYRSFLEDLVRRQELRLPVNPTTDPRNWTLTIPISDLDVVRLALTANASASGYATTVSLADGTSATTTTAITATLLNSAPKKPGTPSNQK